MNGPVDHLPVVAPPAAAVVARADELAIVQLEGEQRVEERDDPLARRPSRVRAAPPHGLAQGGELLGPLADAIDSLAAGDIDGWMSMYAPDAVDEFPWAAEGAVRPLDERDVIAAYMSEFPELIKFGPLTDVRVHEAGNAVRQNSRTEVGSASSAFRATPA
ncbi:nuclear transport factor 2 family protein [Streptomyces sp. RPT161]|uniref:nuclear transport factor 2 family protein n=1 Tax=Streptomyces sp. RPT161 TaxID=3015993 RepID=UPI0022B8D1EE|nr:nuclear transport factor 2 family protein [Streptomyces sp. RPT161]